MDPPIHSKYGKKLVLNLIISAKLAVCTAYEMNLEYGSVDQVASFDENIRDLVQVCLLKKPWLKLKVI
jgi:hypothetical protein